MSSLFIDNEIINDNNILDEIESISEKFIQQNLKQKMKEFIQQLRKKIQIGTEEDYSLLKKELTNENYNELQILDNNQKEKSFINLKRRNDFIIKEEKIENYLPKLNNDNNIVINHNYIKPLFQLEKKKIQEKKTYLIKEYGECIEILKGNSDNDYISLGNESFLLYLLSKDNLSIDKLSKLISNKLKKKEIIQSSEALITSIIASELFEINDMIIIGIDTPIFEYILDYRISFKIDICFINLNILYIIENKYCLDKTMNGWDAHCCILNRKYPNRILNHLKECKKFYYEKIKFVVELGICSNNQHYIDIYYVKRSVEQYDLDNYKNITFLNKMTKIISKKKKKLMKKE